MTQASLFTTMDMEDMNNIINTNLTSMMIGTKFLLRYCNPFHIIEHVPLVLVFVCKCADHATFTLDRAIWEAKPRPREKVVTLSSSTSARC
jgi:hypothetical protein